MKKRRIGLITAIAFLSFLLFSAIYAIYANGENAEEFLYIEEDFDDTSQENIISGYDFNGDRTKFLSLFDGKGYSLPEFNTKNSITELTFDMLFPEMEDDKILFLGEYPLLSIFDDGLQFCGRTILQQINLEWHKIKVIINGEGVQIFINDVKYSDKVSFPPEINPEQLKILFTTTKSKIYLDNVCLKKRQNGDAEILTTDYTRFDCHIHKLYPGLIQAGVTVYNYSDAEIKGKAFLCLYKESKGQIVLEKISAMENTVIQKHSCESFFAQIIVPDSQEKYYLKTFFWEMTDLKPFINNALIENYN